MRRPLILAITVLASAPILAGAANAATITGVPVKPASVTAAPVTPTPQFTPHRRGAPGPGAGRHQGSTGRTGSTCWTYTSC